MVDLDIQRLALAAEVIRLEDDLNYQIARLPKPASEEAWFSYSMWIAEIKRRLIPLIWDARAALDRYLSYEPRQNYLEVADYNPWEMEQMRRKYFAKARAEVTSIHG